MLYKCAVVTNLDGKDDHADIELFGQNELFHHVPDIDQPLDQNE